MVRGFNASAFVAALVLFAAPAAAQKSGGSAAYAPGYTDIGPVVGFGNLGSANLAIGGRFEHGIKSLPDLGDGVLAIEVSADYYHWSNSYAGTDYGFSYIPFGVTANYHFKVSSNPKLDPFVGLGLGYLSVSTKYGGNYDASSTYFIGRAGLRYFYKPKMAFYGDVGAGAATLSAGLMFGLGGGK
ncbi:MAG: outer membrane beta-barrel protein [Gemmatimonadaceae bacterium]